MGVKDDMNKPNMLGFLLLMSAVFVFIFKLIAKLMSQEFNFVFVKDLIGTDWISSIPWTLLQNFAESFTKLTLAGVLLILGTIFITVGTFKRA
jgi:hypothetical protein